MAQNLILCQFCEVSNEIKWKCFNCDLVLCKKCADIHSKFGGSEKHCIIDLTQVGTPENVDTIRRFNLRNIQCTSHAEEKCSLFCKECKKPVCSFCVIELEHKDHKFEKLTNVYNNQLSELKKIKERIDFFLPDISKSVRESTSTCDNYNEIKEKIIQREREIIERVTGEAANLINKLDNLFVPSKHAFMEEKQKIHEMESKMQETNKSIDDALQSHQPSYVLQTIDKVDKHLHLKVNADNIPIKQKFALQVLDSQSINFGSVHKCPILRVANTYETNVQFIYCLKCLKDGTLVCIYRIKSQFFIGYSKKHDEKLIIKKEICVPCSIDSPIDMTVTENDIILYTNDTKYVYCLNAYDEKLAIFYTSDLFLFNCLCTNEIHSLDLTILVGFSEPHGYSYNPEFGIMILDKIGNCLTTLQNFDCFRLHRLCYIEKLTENRNGDINIIDGRTLIVFDSNFEFKWIWRNIHKLTDLVTTQNELVVVSDEDSIHVLSMDGVLLTSIGKKEGICHPMCLHIDNIGQLLVGCDGDVNENAKIQMVKILC